MAYDFSHSSTCLWSFCYLEDEMTPQELNKRFAELCGIFFHAWNTKGMDGQMHFHSRPDFVTDPRLVLRELDRLGLMDKFVAKRYLHQHPIMFVQNILDTTEGRLVNAAIKFMEA
jgi:hypothetical protein